LLNAFALPLDKAPLHLSHHPQIRQNDVAHFASCRDVWVKHGHECLPLLALVNEIEDVAGVAAEPIQTRHNEFVTGS
jgi:hypothetical protein